jgi:hypothetical protein
MKNPLTWLFTLLAAPLVTTAWGDSPAAAPHAGHAALTGAWRAQMHFKSGAFAEVKDLEFMYAYNAGGTLTESSNYDAAPPVPPAYGIWRQAGPNRFQSKYVFYITKAPASFQDITKGGGWSPDGRGVFTEQITLSADGNSYTAKVSYVAFDVNGKPADGGGEGTATGTRITF